MSVQTSFFETLRQLVLAQCGVNLENDRDDLLLSLVEPNLETWGVSSMQDLMRTIEKDPQGSLSQKVVESLVPGETYFFRDPAFFQILESRVLPEIVHRKKDSKSLTLWSAACSTGQEPYSLAMMIHDKFPYLMDWDFRIIASDFSKTVLEQARSGIYNGVESRRGLPPQYLERYMEPVGSNYRVKDEIRLSVEFRNINLKEKWLEEKPVDLLLMRNVMIYFETDMKKSVLTRCRESLGAVGILFLGSSETALFLGGSLNSLPYGDQVVGYHVRQAVSVEGALNLEAIDRFLLDLWATMMGKTPIGTGKKGFRAGTSLISAYIRILGARNLMVRLTVTDKTAADSASYLFGDGKGLVPAELSEDALKEMVNILGGNIKSMMSKHHFLSIPSVAPKTSESLGLPTGEVLFDRYYEVGNEPIHLAVMDLKGA